MRFEGEPHLGADEVRRDVEDLRRRRPVDVVAALEGVDEVPVGRQVREDAQLDLRVVGDDELVARRRDERAADLASGRRADRNVLEIRIGRGEPSGRGDGLPEGRVDAALRVGERRQCVDVGALELRDLAVLEDELREREAALGEVGKDLDARRRGLRLRGLLQDRIAELLEEDLPELDRRVDVELLAGFRPDAAFEVAQVAVHPLGHLVEERDVHGDSRELHPREDRRQRPLDLAVDLLELRPPRELRREDGREGALERPRARRATGRRSRSRSPARARRR